MISVLYVDDEPGLLELGKLFLEKNGRFSVDTVTSADQALSTMKERRYEAIISDYQMPGRDGIEFLKQVRASGNTIPFIIFTGRGREEIVIQALNEGADFYLQKGGEPVSQFAELAHKIEKAVSQRRAETSIRDHERREADIINFLPDATFAIDTKGIVIAWNRAMEAMTGVRAADILGKDNFEYAIPFYHERRPILIDIVLNDDPATIARYPYLKRDGKTLFSEITIPHFNNGKGAALWFTASPLYDIQGNIVGAIESIREITEWKRAERALHESERRFRELSDLLPQVVFEADMEGVLTYANRIAFDLFGYSQDEVRQGFYILQTIAPFDRERAGANIRKLLERGPTQSEADDYLAVRKDGTTFPVTVYSSPVIVNGKTTGLRGVVVDNTERRRIDEALQQSEVRFRSLIQNASDMIRILDRDGKVVYESPSTVAIMGYPAGENIGKDPFAFVHPDDIERVQADLREVYDRKNPGTPTEFRARKADGTYIWVDTIATNMLDVPAVNGIVVTTRPIDQRKRMEQAIRESEELYRTVFETTGTATVLIENDATIYLANSEFVRLSGFLKEEVEGKKKWTEFVIKEDLERMLAQHRLRRTDPGHALKHYEFRFLSRSGGIRDIYLTIDVIPGTERSVASLLDITERKKAEGDLIAANREYVNLLDQIQDIYYRSDTEGRLVKASRSWARLLGYDDVSSCLGKSIADDFYLVPEDRKTFLDLVYREGKVTDYEVTLKRSDGSPVLVSTSSHLYFDTFGNVLGIEGTFRDITERKKMEEELRESERRYRNIFESSLVGIFRSTPEGKYLDMNPAFAKMFGYASPEEMIAAISDIRTQLYVRAEDREPFKERLAQGERVRGFEAEFYHTSGSRIWISINAVAVRSAGGEILYYEGTTEDVTERKLHEHFLKTQLTLGLALQNVRDLKETLDLCLEAAIDIAGMDAGGIYLVDEQSGSVNLVVSRNLGDEFVTSVSLYPAGSDNARIVLAGKPLYVQFSQLGVLHTEVQEREGLKIAAIVPISYGGRVTGCLNITSHVHDRIPEHSRIGLETIAIRIGNAIGRIRSNEALAASEERYRNVVEDQTELISRFLPDGTHVFVNEAYCRYFGLEREKLLGHRFQPEIPREDQERLRHFFESLTQEHPVDIIEHRIIMPDGSVRWQRWSDRAIFDASGVLIEYQSVGRDITTRRQTEEALMESEQRNAAILAALPDLLFIISRDGTYLDFQAADETMLAVPPDQIIGTNIRSAGFDPDTAEKILKAIENAIDTGSLQHVEYQLAIPLGHHTFEARIVRLDNDRVLGIVRDITIIRTADRSIQETGERLHRILQSVQTGIVIIDESTHAILDANKKALELIGAEGDIVIGSICHRFICPSEQGHCPITDLGQMIDASECILVTAEGKQVPVLKTVIPAEIGGRNVLVESFSDITDLKSREDRIRVLGSLLDLIPASITVHDMQGRFVYANAKTFEYHGYTEEEFYRINLHELDVPASEKLIEEHIRELNEKGEVSFEAAHLRKDRSILPLLVNAKMTTWEGSPVILSIATDISERKRMEDLLLSREQEFATLADNSPDLIIRFDTEFRSMYGNRTAERETGFALKDTIGKKPSELPIPATIAGSMEETLRRTLVSGTEQTVQEEFPTPGGNHLYEVRVVPERNDAGSVVSLLAIARDVTERIRIEEALKDTEIQYRALFDNAGTGITIMDRDGTFLMVNQKAADEMGMPKEEIAGKTLFDLFPHDIASRHIEQNKKIIDSGTGTSYEETFPLRTGTRSYLVTLEPLKNSHGETFAVQTSSIGITDRKLAEEKLVRAYEEFQTLLNNIQDVYYRTDADGNLTRISRSMPGLFGYDNIEDLLGKDIAQTFYYHPDDRLKVLEEMKKNGRIVNYEVVVKGKDGSPVWISANSHLLFNPDGSVAGVEGTFRDISEQKRVEAALRESEEKYRSLSEASDDLIFVIDRQDRVTYVNNSAATMLGIPVQELVGKNRNDLFPSEISIQQKRAIEKVFATGMRIRSTGRLHFDDRMLWFDHSLVPVHDAAGTVTHVLGISRDITDLKNTEDALRQRTEELDYRNQILQILLDTVPIGIFMVEAPSGKPIIANREAARLLGRGVLPDVTKGNLADTYEAYIAGTDKRYPAEAMPVVRGMNGESSHIDDMMVIRPDGTQVRLEIFGTPVKDSSGRVVASLVSFLDITERKKAEEMIRSLAQFPEENPHPILRIGRDGALLYANNPGREWLKELQHLDGATLPACILSLVADALERGGVIRQEMQDGFGRFYIATATQPEGEAYVNIYVSDITDRKQAERTIFETNKKINLLTSITRHDVANQVTALKGFAQIALMSNPDPIIADFLNKIDAAGSTIARHIEFTRTYQELGLHAPGWYRISDIAAKQTREGITITCTCEAEIYADPMLEKVFFNLIDNAVRHGGKATTIAITCERADGGLLIGVQDDGIGIPVDQKEKIFEKGYGKNTGFGLFLAREILAITGITISEVGMFGKGARFEMYAPDSAHRFRP